MSPRYVVEFYDGQYRVVDTHEVPVRVVAWTHFKGTAIATVNALNKTARGEDTAA